jgi:hypothetical protein
VFKYSRETDIVKKIENNVLHATIEDFHILIAMRFKISQ